MSARHPIGCACDQAWHHRQSPADLDAARRAERRRTADARRIGKATAHNARRHGAPAVEAPAVEARPP